MALMHIFIGHMEIIWLHNNAGILKCIGHTLGTVQIRSTVQNIRLCIGRRAIQHDPVRIRCDHIMATAVHIIHLQVIVNIMNAHITDATEAIHVQHFVVTIRLWRLHRMLMVCHVRIVTVRIAAAATIRTGRIWSHLIVVRSAKVIVIAYVGVVGRVRGIHGRMDGIR